MNEPMTWDDLCGERTLMAIRTDIKHPFHGEANGVALDLKDIVVFVFEDPSDGYRSSAANPLVARGSLYEFCDNVDYVNVPVLIKRWTKSVDDSADGLEFIDKRNGKTVLLLGTDHSDDYYPSFVCDWQPKNLAENSNAA